MDITGLRVHPAAAATIMPPAAAGITTLRPVLQVVGGTGRPAALPAAITDTDRVLPQWGRDGYQGDYAPRIIA